MPAAACRPVIIVTPYYAPVLGGAETAAAQLAEFLAARGRNVTVLTKRVVRDVPDREVLNGVRVVRVPPRGARRGVAKWIALPFVTRELLRRDPVDAVVVCIDFRAVGLAALFSRRVTGRPVVLQAVTEGVLGFAAVKRGLARVGLTGLAGTAVGQLQRLYNTANAYPCISQAIAAETRAAGVPPDRIFYLPNPVDTREFSPATPEQRAALRARHALPIDARVAVVVGRLSREKGQLEALRAWKRVGVEGARLLIVGPDMPDDPWNIGPETRDFVRREGLQAGVVFTGGVSRAEIPDYLRLADLLIHPSHFEAFGTAAIEAMAAGLPVIASDVGGLKDFVEPGVNGLRVPPRDPDALARAIVELLGDDVKRAAMAVGARSTALRFDTERVLSAFERIIDAV